MGLSPAGGKGRLALSALRYGNDGGPPLPLSSPSSSSLMPMSCSFCHSISNLSSCTQGKNKHYHFCKFVFSSFVGHFYCQRTVRRRHQFQFIQCMHDSISCRPVRWPQQTVRSLHCTAAVQMRVRQYWHPAAVCLPSPPAPAQQ